MAGETNNGNGSGPLEELQTYPILTQELSLPTRPGTAAPGAPLGQMVEAALRDVLGWRPKAGDPKGFVAALNQSFSTREVDGRTQVAWTPRTHAVQADLGAITGAQASIYTRAKAAVEQALPLLDGLYPLRVDADPQDIESLRGIVRSELTELVTELGIVGGPREQRVDSLFSLLVEYRPRDGASTDLGDILADPAENVTGQLRELRDRFGLTPSRVNTIAEEQNLTNFLILVEHIVTLAMSWNAIRGYFDGTGTDTFLGTQLVLLSRALTNVSESVHEVQFVLDSLFLGAGERESAHIPIVVQNVGSTRITIAELLSWVDRFASVEGPKLLQDAGKDGVFAFLPQIQQIRDLVAGAALHAQEKVPANRKLNPGFYSLRSVRSWQELERQVNGAVDLAKAVKRQPPPVVEFVSPASIEIGTGSQSAQVRIIGKNFLTDKSKPATVALVGNLLGNEPRKQFGASVSVFIQSETEMIVTFVQTAATLSGTIDAFVVVTQDDQMSNDNIVLTIDPIGDVDPGLTVGGANTSPGGGPSPSPAAPPSSPLPPPSATHFFGTATVDGRAAAEGVRVEVRLGEQTCGIGFVGKRGSFTVDTRPDVVNVLGAQDGDPVNFVLDNLPAEAQPVDESKSELKAGHLVKVNLNATTSPRQ